MSFVLIHKACLKRFFSVLAKCFISVIVKAAELSQINREKARGVLLDSGAPTQPISTVLMALCICRQDRHKYLAIQSLAAEKKSVRRRDY